MSISYAKKRQIYEDGYTVVPGVVPPFMIERALKHINSSIGDSEKLRKLSTDPLITGLFNDTPARTLVESLVGDDYHPIRNAQIALRFPLLDDPAPKLAPHLDGMLQIKNGIVQNFTALVGILLSDLPVENGGNFNTFPGSHRKYEQYFKEHGPDVLLTEESFGTIHHSPNVPLGNPVPVTGKAGDIILCHYQLIHSVGPNVWHNIRYACFFRIDHIERSRDWRAPLTNIWMHWPGMKDILDKDEIKSVRTLTKRTNTFVEL